MAIVDLLVTVKPTDVERYRSLFPGRDDFRPSWATSTADALNILADRTHHTDVLVLDNNLESDVHLIVSEVRQRYPRLMIVLIDEEADFAMPGLADDISIEPFKDHDLVRRISRLISERRTETLRSDSLPAVREFVKRLRDATGSLGKQEVAVQVCKDFNYDYVAYYQREPGDPLRLTLRAQAGSMPLQASAPKEATADDLMGWVLINAQSRIAAPDDRPNHPLVARGRLGAVACVPVTFNMISRGVIVACREQPGTITQENVLLLELVGAQLAAALAKERTS
jgi:DNA-binding response OmpR family regulator